MVRGCLWTPPWHAGLSARNRRQPRQWSRRARTVPEARVRCDRLRQPRPRPVRWRRMHLRVFRKTGSPASAGHRGSRTHRFVRWLARRGDRPTGSRRQQPHLNRHRRGFLLRSPDGGNRAGAVFLHLQSHRESLRDRPTARTLPDRRGESARGRPIHQNSGAVDSWRGRPRYPPDHSRRLFAALSGPKRLILVPGASHGRSLGGKDVWKQIDQWIDSVVGG